MSPSASGHVDGSNIPNPFLESVIGSALDRNPTDVGEINATAFEKCLALIREVRSQRLTLAMLLYGEPGSGKTHLLSRLRKTLARSHEASLFVPVRMLTSAAMLWRFLRRNLAEALLRQQDDGTRAIHRVIAKGRDEIAEMDRSLGIVLGNLIEGRYFAESAAWLKGDDLPEDALRHLNIPAMSDEEETEAASQRMIKAICRLGEPVPFVFCLDQLESMQSYSGDTAGFFRLGKAVSALHDDTRNAAIFSCLQTALIDDLEKGVRGADADRMLSRRSALAPLTWEQALQVAAARLDTVPELRERPSAIWPIDEKDLRTLFAADGLCVARRVIVKCQDLFNAWQNKAPEPPVDIDAVVERFYQAQLRATASNESDAILRDSLNALLRLRGLKFRAEQSSLEGVLEGAGGAALAVANQRTQGPGLVKRLDKIQADWKRSGVPRLFILRDARIGIGPSAKKTRERLAEMETAGAKLVSVTPEALSAMAAIGRLLADARSGDLAYRGESVGASQVEQWLAKWMPAAADDLLDQMAGGAAAETGDVLPLLMDLVNSYKVIEVAEAAARLEKPPEEVEACARSNAALLGFAGGSRRVLFRLVRRTAAE